MPRQIFNNLAMGLSNDTVTIQHENNAQYCQNMARNKLDFPMLNTSLKKARRVTGRRGDSGVCAVNHQLLS